MVEKENIPELVGWSENGKEMENRATTGRNNNAKPAPYKSKAARGPQKKRSQPDLRNQKQTIRVLFKILLKRPKGERGGKNWP